MDDITSQITEQAASVAGDRNWVLRASHPSIRKAASLLRGGPNPENPPPRKFPLFVRSGRTLLRRVMRHFIRFHEEVAYATLLALNDVRAEAEASDNALRQELLSRLEAENRRPVFDPQQQEEQCQRKLLPLQLDLERLNNLVQEQAASIKMLQAQINAMQRQGRS